MGLMLLEGEVDWTRIFAALAVLGHVLALVALIFAVRNGRGRHHVSTRLEDARQIAALTDKRLFEVLNAIPVALVQTDTQGKFIFANRAAHQLLGRRDAELLGLRFHSATWGIAFPDGRSIPPDMLPTARALRGQTVKGFQHLLANPSTRRRMLVSATAMPIQDEMGQVTGSITAIVETESLTTPEIVAPVLPEREAAEPIVSGDADAQTLEAVGRQTAGLARDFGGLLAVMTSALDLATDPATSPEKARRLTQAALGAGRRGEILTSRMAALGTTETPLSDQVMDLTVLVRSLEGRLRARAGEGVDLMISAPAEPLSLRLDPVAVEAVLNALVSNAVEAGAGSIAIGLEARGEGAVLSVRDDGCGMDAEAARRATETFFTTRPGSAGLGLAQATALARSSGGDLTLETAPGQGTQVRLTLCPGEG